MSKEKPSFAEMTAAKAKEIEATADAPAPEKAGQGKTTQEAPTQEQQTQPESSLMEKVLDFGGKVWDAGKPMFDHGRDEAASLLFAGHGHVPYGWNSVNEGEEFKPPETPQVEKDQGKEQENDGLSR